MEEGSERCRDWNSHNKSTGLAEVFVYSRLCFRMHSYFTGVPTAPLSFWLKYNLLALEHSIFYSLMILEDDQAPNFSGFSNPFLAWIVRDEHNSFFIRNQFNKNLQLEPSSVRKKLFKFDSIHLTDPTATLSQLALTLSFSSIHRN